MVYLVSGCPTWQWLIRPLHEAFSNHCTEILLLVRWREWNCKPVMPDSDASEAFCRSEQTQCLDIIMKGTVSANAGVGATANILHSVRAKEGAHGDSLQTGHLEWFSRLKRLLMLPCCARSSSVCYVMTTCNMSAGRAQKQTQPFGNDSIVPREHRMHLCRSHLS